MARSVHIASLCKNFLHKKKNKRQPHYERNLYCGNHHHTRDDSWEKKKVEQSQARHHRNAIEKMFGSQPMATALAEGFDDNQKMAWTGYDGTDHVWSTPVAGAVGTNYHCQTSKAGVTTELQIFQKELDLRLRYKNYLNLTNCHEWCLRKTAHSK